MVSILKVTASYSRSVSPPHDFSPFPSRATEGSIPRRSEEIVTEFQDKSAVRGVLANGHLFCPISPHDPPNLDKINRKKGSETVVPRTEYETGIHNIWAGVLGHTQFGVKDRFISVGGDLPHAMRVLDQSKCRTRIPINEFLTAGTVETLVDLVRRVRQSTIKGESITSIHGRGKADILVSAETKF